MALFALALVASLVCYPAFNAAETSQQNISRRGLPEENGKRSNAAPLRLENRRRIGIASASSETALSPYTIRVSDAETGRALPGVSISRPRSVSSQFVASPEPPALGTTSVDGTLVVEGLGGESLVAECASYCAQIFILPSGQSPSRAVEVLLHGSRTLIVNCKTMAGESIPGIPVRAGRLAGIDRLALNDPRRRTGWGVGEHEGVVYGTSDDNGVARLEGLPADGQLLVDGGGAHYFLPDGLQVVDSPGVNSSVELILSPVYYGLFAAEGLSEPGARIRTRYPAGCIDLERLCPEIWPVAVQPDLAVYREQGLGIVAVAAKTASSAMFGASVGVRVVSSHGVVSNGDVPLWRYSELDYVHPESLIVKSRTDLSPFSFELRDARGERLGAASAFIYVRYGKEPRRLDFRCDGTSYQAPPGRYEVRSQARWLDQALKGTTISIPGDNESSIAIDARCVTISAESESLGALRAFSLLVESGGGKSMVSTAEGSVEVPLPPGETRISVIYQNGFFFGGSLLIEGEAELSQFTAVVP